MKNDRWPVAIIFHMLDMGEINAFKIWKLKNPSYVDGYLDARRNLILALGKELMREHVLERYGRAGMQTCVKEHIKRGFPEVSKTPPETLPELTQGRCHICDRPRDRKSRRFTDCQKFVCPVH